MRPGTAFHQHPKGLHADALPGRTSRGLIADLLGTTCRCGATKAHGHTFCGPCYYGLPLSLRRDLYKRIGEGYEEAYERACGVLQRQLSAASGAF
jgi:hypothetical protein